MKRAVALALALGLALEPGFLHAARVVTRVAPAAVPGAGAAGGGARAARAALTLPSRTLSSLALPRTPLQSPSVAPRLAPAAISAAGPMEAAPVAAASAFGARPAPTSLRPAARTPATISATRGIPLNPARTPLTRRLNALGREVARAAEGLARLPAVGARGAAERQFALISGEMPLRPDADGPAEPATVRWSALRGGTGRLAPALAARERPEDGGPGFEPPATPPAPPAKRGFFQVFRNPEFNRAYWRLFLGEAIYLLGFQMYMVALPFLMKSFTRNTLSENGQLRDTTAEALNELVRRNRSLARFAHWTAQALSYVAIPLFTRDGATGPRRWLVRAAFIRAAVLFGIPALFFASGALSAPAALGVLLALIGVQSFFQGLYVTMMSGASARIMGHDSVQPDERMRANSLRTLMGAVLAIIAPFVAGQLAGMPDWLGKAGTGSAIIYGIYAAAVGLSGLVFATIRLLGAKAGAASSASAPGAAQPDPGGSRLGRLWGALKNAGVSMGQGIRLILRNRFLLTLLALNLITSLFSDPLVFNVLPEFVEGVVKTSPGALDALLGVPLLGAFFKGLVGTPAGFFALLLTASSLGSAAASLLLNPLRKLFKRLGFESEERLTIPFYILAFLQVPAFWWMIHTGSFLGVLGLYGLQTFLAGFSGMIVMGIFQKKIRGYDDKQMNQVLAANSFVGILAAIAATLLYGFILNGIPIRTSLWIAAIATTALGVAQLVAPWLMFRKEERRGEKPSHAPGEKPDHAATNHGGEHLPNGNGPLNLTVGF